MSEHNAEPTWREHPTALYVWWLVDKTGALIAEVGSVNVGGGGAWYAVVGKDRLPLKYASKEAAQRAAETALSAPVKPEAAPVIAWWDTKERDVPFIPARYKQANPKAFARYTVPLVTGSHQEVAPALPHPLTWDALAKAGRVDSLPFRVPGTMRSEKVECVILTRADVARLEATTQAQPASPLGSRHKIEHDGFEGEVIGYYTTREGKRGVVLQQLTTKVVHVYGEKWLAAQPASPAHVELTKREGQ